MASAAVEEAVEAAAEDRAVREAKEAVATKVRNSSR